MRACFLAMLSLLAATSSPAQRPYTEKQVIAYAKLIDVNTLDPSLPSQHLKDWLQSGAPRSQRLSWLVEDTCWLKPGPDPNEDYPLCAHIRIIRNGQWGEFLIQVGTFHKGIVGRPKLSSFPISVQDDGMGSSTADAERLSDLPGLLDQPNRFIVDGVRKLYREVVERHPIGIPAGAEKIAIWPFLSKRLIAQLQTAHSCEEDYFRQRRTVDSAAKPGWLNTDIFSGDGNRTIPTNSFAYNTGQQKDGSFRVYADLTFAGDPGIWEVAVRVIAEDSRFVIDDVRIFDRIFTDTDGNFYRLPGPNDGPSHLLSESFAGCDGPRWAGLAVAHK